MTIKSLTEQLIKQLSDLPDEKRIDAINEIRKAIHVVSPFRGEPVDCVLWVPIGSVVANDYNPNSVAGPEMRLLEKSIEADGYTQPIVTWESEATRFTVVDGFHRHIVGKKHGPVSSRIHGRLPVTKINGERTDRADRIASTIRHNRARGKHGVEAMGDIVIELVRRNWTDDKIAKELGMDRDEVLRLKQITGLAELFSGQDFSKAWEPC